MKANLKIRFLQAVIGVVFGCTMCFGGGMGAHASATELSIAHHLPVMAPAAKALEQWAKKLEADTGGRLKFTIYPSSSLVKGRDAYSSTVGGVCDIAFVNNVYESSKWALNNIVDSAALQIPTDERGVQVWDQLWKKFPVMLKELEGVKVLSHSISMSSSFHTKKAIRIPADTKGMKIAVMGDKAKLLKEIGASPVGIPANDWYLSLERGVLDGLLCPPGVMTDRGLEVLVPYHLDVKLGQGGNSIIMNLNKFNSLPPDIRAKFEQLYSYTNELMFKANQRVEDEAWEKCRKLGHTIITPIPEESKLWLAAAELLADEWIKQNAKKGPTKEMFDFARKSIEKTAK